MSKGKNDKDMIYAGDNVTWLGSGFKLLYYMVSDVPLHDDERCAATSRNKLYGDLGALHCLASGYADVAFVNAYNLSNILRTYQHVKLTENTVIDF
jgi:hypothetical protein